MPRYIDADALYDAIENRYRVSSGIEHRCERELLDLICDAPTADVVPVVRCKDCKHYIRSDIGWCDLHSHFTDQDGNPCEPSESPNWTMFIDTDFCSYGAKMDLEG